MTLSLLPSADEVVQLYEGGQSARQIARYFGFCVARASEGGDSWRTSLGKLSDQHFDLGHTRGWFLRSLLV